MYIVDRRLNPKGKNLANTQRFFNRIKDDIKKSIQNTIDDANIADTVNPNISTKNVIKVTESSVHEPSFRFAYDKGKYSFVLPGNKNHEEDMISYQGPIMPVTNKFLAYKEGDKIYKPRGAPASGGSSSDGNGVDDFLFVLSPEEYSKLLLEDLELPNQEERMKDTETFSLQRAGYTMIGTPANLALLRTLKNSYGRRIGLHRPKNEEIEELETKLENPFLEEMEKIALEEELFLLKQRQERIPYIDPFDVRYNNFVPEMTPKFKAVMFCLMDCSGSMSEKQKDLAKRFYVILYRFLKIKYEKVEVVFIRHTTTAKIVDEQTFFYSPETGGTIVSSAMEAMLEEIKNHYNPLEWNIYGAQISDGDNAYEDNDKTINLLQDKILPMVSYYAYIETKRVNQGGWSTNDSALWELYGKLPKSLKFAMKQVSGRADIYPVFRQLFSKKD